MCSRWALTLGVLAACTSAPPAPAPPPPPAPPPAASLAAPRALCEGPGCLPAFRVRTVDGKALASDDLAHQVSLVMFWASWCEPCVTEGPGIDAVYRRHREEGFTIVGLSRDQVDDAGLRAFRDAHRISYPIALADDALFATFGSPPEIPTLMLYGKDGRLRWRGTGALPAEILEGEVGRALAAVDAPGEAARSLSVVVVRRLDDPARVAGLLAARRQAGPTVAVLTAERTGTAPRVVNALRFDAWATASRPAGATAPAVVQGIRGTGARSYAIAQVQGLRVAVVGRGDAAAVDQAASLARRDGQAHLVVTLGHPAGDVDAPAAGPPVEWVELSLDQQGKIVRSERRAVDLAAIAPDPAVAGLLR